MVEQSGHDHGNEAHGALTVYGLQFPSYYKRLVYHLFEYCLLDHGTEAIHC